MLRPALLAAAVIPVIASAQSTPAARLGPSRRRSSLTVMPPPDKFRQALISWEAGPVTCAGVSVSPDLLPEPLAAVGTVPVDTAAEAKPAGSPRFTFCIDTTGRVLDIQAEKDGYLAFGADLVPSLAAARFPAGRARSGCSIAYARQAVGFADAELEALIKYTIFPTMRPPQAIWDRIKPAGSDCLDNPSPPLTRAFPDFGRIPQAPGTLSWTLVGYDIDEQGRTVRARPVAGSGNPALDKLAVSAIERSTFTPGARRGCLNPSWRRGGLLPAPEAPALSTFRPDGSTCPNDLPWARAPRLTYPEPFRRRGVEGWAVVAYDVAPWGEMGNMRVIEAQPAAAFGDAALGVLRAASKQPSGTGATGCVDRVLFVTAPEGAGRVGAEGPIPPVG